MSFPYRCSFSSNNNNLTATTSWWPYSREDEYKTSRCQEQHNSHKDRSNLDVSLSLFHEKKFFLNSLFSEIKKGGEGEERVSSVVKISFSWRRKERERDEICVCVSRKMDQELKRNASRLSVNLLRDKVADVDVQVEMETRLKVTNNCLNLSPSRHEPTLPSSSKANKQRHNNSIIDNPSSQSSSQSLSHSCSYKNNSKSASISSLFLAPILLTLVIVTCSNNFIASTSAGYLSGKPFATDYDETGAIEGVECISNGKFYRNPEFKDGVRDCAKYYWCPRGKVLEFRCSAGLWFDIDRQICDFKSKIRNCEKSHGRQN